MGTVCADCNLVVVLLSNEAVLQKSLFQKASSSAPLLLLLRVLQGDVCSVQAQDAPVASPSSPNLIRTKNEGRCVALVAYLTSFTQRMESSWHGRDKRPAFTARGASGGLRRAAWTGVLLRRLQGRAGSHSEAGQAVVERGAQAQVSVRAG